MLCLDDDHPIGSDAIVARGQQAFLVELRSDEAQISKRRCSQSAILAGVPQAQQVDGGICDFVAHLVVSDPNPPHVTRLELFQLFTDAWVGQQRDRCCRELLHRARRSRPVHRRQELVEAGQIRQSFARPFQLHLFGTGSGVSVLRLSAQAWTA